MGKIVYFKKFNLIFIDKYCRSNTTKNRRRYTKRSTKRYLRDRSIAGEHEYIFMQIILLESARFFSKARVTLSYFLDSVDPTHVILRTFTKSLFLFLTSGLQFDASSKLPKVPCVRFVQCHSAKLRRYRSTPNHVTAEGSEDNKNFCLILRKMELFQ